MIGFSSSKKRLFLLVGFLVAFLIVLIVSTTLLYSRAKSQLDNELGERLRAIATTLAHTVELELPDSLHTAAVPSSFYTMLHVTRAENLLSNVVILTTDGRTIVDLGDFSEPGELNPFIELDFSAVSLARSGLAAYTSLYRTDDVYLKSAYAPVVASDGRVIGILGVEAGAAFFDVLNVLSNAIIFINVIGFLIIVALGFYFYRQSVSLDRAHAAVIQGENLSTMGRMVAGIAHEIRNPLSIIKTSAERIRKKYNPEDEVFSYISEEVDNLDRILTGYLNFAKAEGQEFERHSIQRIIRRCRMILDPELDQKQIEFVEDIPTDDIAIHCDDNQIQQALLNVLLNAVQAVKPGGRIELALEKNARLARLSVRDNGGGISEKNLREVTKPFFTTKEHGSGLGLNIVSSIVERHRGKLDIESSLGAGTSVAMHIPLAKEEKNG